MKEVVSEPNLCTSTKHKEIVVALAGNPNVGKSTLFNTLTGLKQHTGNWIGKTVDTAYGSHVYGKDKFMIVDLPGTYSLMPHSAEEEVARDFICFGCADMVVVVVDAVCLERNLNLVLQTIEITPNVVVCVNLMDEAKKKNIDIDLEKIEKLLGVSVVGISARHNEGIDKLMECVKKGTLKKDITTNKIKYMSVIENAIEKVMFSISDINVKCSKRFIALQLLSKDEDTIKAIKQNTNFDTDNKFLIKTVEDAWVYLSDNGYTVEKFRDTVVSNILINAEGIANECVHILDNKFTERERKIDRVLTSKVTGIPIMLLLLCIIFWITITGANYPSELLSKFLFWGQDKITMVFEYFNAPSWLHDPLVLGVYRVLAWVVAVMLPPMAIFFPMFTILEDLGYLPRVAFNLDYYFKKCNACGKQCLTMCQGIGCNAVGVTGARIIDSPRERLIAILTNNFVPCNGRFPTLISVITMFFISSFSGWGQSILSSLILTAVILFGVFLTFIVSKWLSNTLLKGEPSSFTLELPPYRKPQFGKVIVRSIFDRTLFVLRRAVIVAAPAGLIIWCMANISVGGSTILYHCSSFLDPFAKLMGLDGTILLAFILGFPANEIVVPIIIMTYMASGTLMEFESLNELKALLVANGWDWVRAVSMLLFCLVHWPCSTTCLTIKKETNSWKWTALAIAIPTVLGVCICMLFNLAVNGVRFIL